MVFCYTGVDKQRVRELGVTSRIEVVSNRIDTERFTPEGSESNLIDAEGPVVLFVGRFAEALAEYPEAEVGVLEIEEAVASGTTVVTSQLEQIENIVNSCGQAVEDMSAGSLFDSILTCSSRLERPRSKQSRNTSGNRQSSFETFSGRSDARLLISPGSSAT